MFYCKNLVLLFLVLVVIKWCVNRPDVLSIGSTFTIIYITCLLVQCKLAVIWYFLLDIHLGIKLNYKININGVNFVSILVSLLFSIA